MEATGGGVDGADGVGAGEDGIWLPMNVWAAGVWKFGLSPLLNRLAVGADVEVGAGVVVVGFTVVVADGEEGTGVGDGVGAGRTGPMNPWVVVLGVGVATVGLSLLFR